jgi:prophage regulatory protein
VTEDRGAFRSSMREDAAQRGDRVFAPHRVNQLVADDPTFPKPAAELTAGRVWKRADVEAWARRTGRL